MRLTTRESRRRDLPSSFSKFDLNILFTVIPVRFPRTLRARIVGRDTKPFTRRQAYTCGRPGDAMTYVRLRDDDSIFRKSAITLHRRERPTKRETIKTDGVQDVLSEIKKNPMTKSERHWTGDYVVRAVFYFPKPCHRRP